MAIGAGIVLGVAVLVAAKVGAAAMLDDDRAVDAMADDPDESHFNANGYHVGPPPVRPPIDL